MKLHSSEKFVTVVFKTTVKLIELFYITIILSNHLFIGIENHNLQVLLLLIRT